MSKPHLHLPAATVGDDSGPCFSDQFMKAAQLQGQGQDESGTQAKRTEEGPRPPVLASRKTRKRKQKLNKKPTRSLHPRGHHSVPCSQCGCCDVTVAVNLKTDVRTGCRNQHPEPHCGHAELD
ncbi:hypothetical protein K523DRAFT_322223 [Schizophyllum commune Tattone D]|nr:hypothetical protein K523DRAFT_322223 [Schizophyllum commune Tattone D]